MIPLEGASLFEDLCLPEDLCLLEGASLLEDLCLHEEAKWPGLAKRLWAPPWAGAGQ